MQNTELETPNYVKYSVTNSKLKGIGINLKECII